MDDSIGNKEQVGNLVARMSTGIFVRAGRYFCFLFFVSTGIGKLIEPGPASLALLRDFDLPYSLALKSTLALSSLELLVALGLIWRRFTSSILLVIGGGMSAGFAVFASWKVAINDNSPCGCFGALMPDLTPGMRLLLALLMLLAFIALWRSEKKLKGSTGDRWHLNK